MGDKSRVEERENKSREARDRDVWLKGRKKTKLSPRVYKYYIYIYTYIYANRFREFSLAYICVYTRYRLADRRVHTVFSGCCCCCCCGLKRRRRLDWLSFSRLIAVLCATGWPSSLPRHANTHLYESCARGPRDNLHLSQAVASIRCLDPLF